MNTRLIGIVLASSLSAIPVGAGAQTAERSQHRAFVVNTEAMIGILGVGTYLRINPEIQLHKDQRFGGHAFNLGLAVILWPNEAGPSFALAPRYQFDHQLVRGTLFFVSPYAGLDAGLGVFDVFSDGARPRFLFILAPSAGLDLKLLLSNRLVLGFRPIGVSVPIFFGGRRVAVDVLYDISVSVGFTF